MAMALGDLLAALEIQESLCCSVHALYNALCLYPETLFGATVPAPEDFRSGLLRLPDVEAIDARGGLDDAGLDAVAQALKLDGGPLPVPTSESELRRLLSTPGRAVLGRLKLRDPGRGDPGVRHSVVFLPSDDREPLFQIMDSNAALGMLGAFNWTQMSRFLCGAYSLEVRGQAARPGNAVAGFGTKLDAAPRRRRADIADLLAALKDFSKNYFIGLESLTLAVKARPDSAPLRALQGAIAVVAPMRPPSGPRNEAAARAAMDEFFLQAMADFKEVRRLEPQLQRELPEGLRRREWRFGSDAFGALAAAAVWKEAPDEWIEKAIMAVARMW